MAAKLKLCKCVYGKAIWTPKGKIELNSETSQKDIKYLKDTLNYEFVEEVAAKKD